MPRISLYGIGSFGFALLRHLSNKAGKGILEIKAYDRDEDLRRSLKKDRKHLIQHKNIRISRKIKIVDNEKSLLVDADILILAVTSEVVREVIFRCRPFIAKDLIILNTAKALEPSTGLRCSQVVGEALGGLGCEIKIAMFAGGTIAQDLFFDEPLGADIACADEKVLKTLKDILVSDNLNIYATTDLTGVEYAAAFKNVIAILAGIINGLGFSYGSETHLISRIASEVENLVVGKLGGGKATFSMGSQCWGNDMWMSATGNTRNREFGILIGRGYAASRALQKMEKENKTVEGVNTILALNKILNGDSRNYPLLYHVGEIVFNGNNPKKTILRLMKSNGI